jgi:hypothetical protein
MKEVTIFVTYCDDVRAEVGGKQSLMGVYNAQLLVASLPVTLPKLCANVILNIPNTVDIKSIVLRAYANDVQIGEEVVPEEALPGIREFSRRVAGDPEQWVAVNVTFVFSPFAIEGETKIGIKAVVNGDITKGNALQIRVPGAEEAAALGMTLPH